MEIMFHEEHLADIQLYATYAESDYGPSTVDICGRQKNSSVLT